MPARFEAHAIHPAVHFRDAHDLRDLVAQRSAFLQVHRLAAKAAGLSQPLGNHVSHYDARCTQQLAGGRTCQPDRSRASHVGNRPWPDPRRHAWTLREGKGITLLTRYLWNDASPENKARARKTFESLLRLKYEKYYIRGEGAFCYYPGSQHATLDGTGSALVNLDDAGSFSAGKQRHIWGGPEQTCANLGQVTAATLTEADLAPLRNAKEVNSFRYYRGAPDPDDFTAQVEGVFYAGEAPVLDLVELAPGLKAWADATTQSMGNWTSRQEILEELSRVHTGRVPVFRGGIPLDRLNKALQGNGTVPVVGFDVFQVPVCRITYTRP